MICKNLQEIAEIAKKHKLIILSDEIYSRLTFNNKYKSVERQLEIQQEELRAQRENRKNELDSRLKEALQQRISARISYQTQQKNIEQAQDAEAILLKQYETGILDFQDVLDIQELQLKFQLKQVEAIKNYYLQTAIINYLSN